MVALLVFITATLAEKNCQTQKVHLVITLSKIRLDVYAINYLRNSKCASPVTFSIEVICGSLSKAIVKLKLFQAVTYLRFDGILLGLLFGTWDTLGDKLQQQVAATDHSVCAGPTTSCSPMLGRHVAATNRFVCDGESFVKILSQSTTEFCRRNRSLKFCLI